MPSVYRDRDVRNAMLALVEASGAFDLATCGGLPEVQVVSADAARMIVIDPLDSTDDDNWDDPAGPVIVRSATVTVTVIVIDEDPVTRDEAAEQLCNIAADAWNGVSLAGITYPDQTRIWTWQWLKPTTAERRIQGKFVYKYEVPFQGFGTDA